jgi:hypothetical protein
VRLLQHHPDSGAMLLERLDASRDLSTMKDDLAAAEIIAKAIGGPSFRARASKGCATCAMSQRPPCQMRPKQSGLWVTRRSVSS